MPSPKPVALELSDEERRVLTRMDTSSYDRAGIGVAVADCVGVCQGRSNTEVAASLAVSGETVRKWRARLVRDRLEGMTDAPRPGAPRKITDEQVERGNHGHPGAQAAAR